MKTLLLAYILSSAVTTGTSLNAHNHGCYEGAAVARYLPGINSNGMHVGYKAGQTIGLTFIIHKWDKKFKEENKSTLAPILAVVGMTTVNVLDSTHNLRVNCSK